MRSKISRIVMLFICMNLTVFAIFITQVQNVNAADGLKIHYIDVGSGDSIYIECGGENMLIDGGYLTQSDREDDETIKTPLDRYIHDGDSTMLDPTVGNSTEQFKKLLKDNDNSDVTEYLDSLGVRNINYVISTHPHYDHIGGLIQVINKYTYNHIYYNGRPYNKYLPIFLDLANYNTSKNGVALKVPQKGESFELGTGNQKAKITIISDQSKDYQTISGDGDADNNGSLVLRLDYGSRSFLFTGDAQVAAQKDLITNSSNLISNIDVLKVPHHGHTNNDFVVSSVSGNYDFFIKTNPVLSIVQSGLKNTSLSIPTNKVVNDLSMSDIFTNKELGNIVLSCDGTHINVLYNSTTLHTFNVGDVNLDGNITPADYVMLRKHINGSSVLSGAKLWAADVTGDVNKAVTPADYVKLRKVINGSASL